MKGHVYQLICPVQNRPIYVGSTVKAFNDRLSNHLCSKSKSKLHRYLREHNIKPSIEVLEEVEYGTRQELLIREKHWIIELSKVDQLLNKAHNPQEKCNKVIYESVKLPRSYMRRLRDYKQKTGKSLLKIISEAIQEKLDRQKLAIRIPN